MPTVPRVTPPGRASRAELPAFQHVLLVRETGSFRKAAKLIGVQPSVISRSVRSLEDEIGVSLFHRRFRGAEPTPAGEAILPRMRKVLDELRLISSTARNNGRGAEGSLKTGIVASIAGGRARDLLLTFLQEHRAITLEVFQGDPRDHISAIAALQMDAAIVVGQPPAPGCLIENLWLESIMVALPTSHPLTSLESIGWRHLNAEKFLVSRAEPGPEIQDYIIKHLAALGHRPQVEHRSVCRDGLLALIGLGQGITLVSAAEAEVKYPGVVFKPLLGEQLPYGLVWSEQNDNPVLRRFMSHARRWSRGQRSVADDYDGSL